MKKLLIPALALALILSASVVFAGLTLTPSGNADEYATLNNTAEAVRVFKVQVTCERQTVSDSYDIDPNEPETAYYDGPEAEMPQQWSVVVADMAGQQITQCTFTYDGSQFHAGQIGDGLTFEATGRSVTLTVTK